MKRPDTSIAPCLAAVFLLAALVAGCSSIPAYRGGPAGLTPVPDPGYSMEAGGALYEDDSIMVSVTEPAPDELPGLFSELHSAGYVFLTVRVENLSDARVIFKPSYIRLTTDALDYSAPLDYTDLYEVARERGDPGEILTPVREKFYDLDVTLRPGGSVERLLVFRERSSGSDDAELRIREVYVGGTARDLAFGLAVTPAGAPEKTD